MIVIGITGKAGAGKDTVADRLVARHGFKKMAFAGPLKGVLHAMDPILGMDIYNPGRLIRLNEALAKYGEDGVKKVYGEYRNLAQKLGTEGIRKIDEDFWIKAFCKQLNGEPRDARIVVPDTRFMNESATVRRLNPDLFTSELWHVRRPASEISIGEVPAHASEALAGNLMEQVTLNNTRTIEALHSIIDSYARDLIGVEQVKLGGR